MMSVALKTESAESAESAAFKEYYSSTWNTRPSDETDRQQPRVL